MLLIARPQVSMWLVWGSAAHRPGRATTHNKLNKEVPVSLPNQPDGFLMSPVLRVLWRQLLPASIDMLLSSMIMMTSSHLPVLLQSDMACDICSRFKILITSTRLWCDSKTAGCDIAVPCCATRQAQRSEFRMPWDTEITGTHADRMGTTTTHDQIHNRVCKDHP